MHYLFGFLCVCALGVMPVVGCFDVDILDDACEGVVCEDDNDCTRDGCRAQLFGAHCFYIPLDDGTACNLDGVAGVCIGGACDLCERVVCDDGNECTVDCNPATGTCDYIPVDDGTLCDFDGLDGVCVNGFCGENLCEDVACDDGNACTEGLCDHRDGMCDFEPKVCDDGNECTEDLCDPAFGCDFTALVEDGTECGTGHWCIAGGCEPPCDTASEEVYQCPIEAGADWFCCPWSQLCQMQCD